MQESLFTRPPKTMKTPRALTIQDMFGYSREAWLTECRKTAKQLLRYMDWVTSEDIIKLVPRPTYLHRNTVGAIFDGQFKPVGFVKAQRVEAKGRWIRQWRLK